MSNQTGTASSSRGPVVRTRVAGRAPAVHVSFPETTPSPSLLARCQSKVSGWISDMSEGEFAAVMVGVMLGFLLTVFTVIGFQERAALQKRIGEVQMKNAEQQGQLNYLLNEVRSLRAARPAPGGSATNAESPHVKGPSVSWLDNPALAPPPPGSVATANTPVLLVAADQGRGADRRTPRGNAPLLGLDETLDPPLAGPEEERQ